MIRHANTARSGSQALPGHLQPELIEAAERGQIRASEGSVRHVEVFQLGSVRTPIIGRPRPLPRQRRADHPYTLNCEEPLMPGVAEAAPPRGENFCSSPIFVGSGPPEWRDLNQRYGVKERIIGPPAPAADNTPSDGCLEAFAGEQWVRAVPPWLTATIALRDEFYNRFDHARYVIDEGTAQEKTITAGKEILRTGMVPQDVTIPPGTGGLPYVVPVSPVLNPLSPTKGCVPSSNPADPGPCHTSTLYVTMTAGDDVCTGRGAAPGLGGTGCLPGGEESKWPILANWSFKVSSQPPPTPTSIPPTPTPIG